MLFFIISFEVRNLCLLAHLIARAAHLSTFCYKCITNSPKLALAVMFAHLCLKNKQKKPHTNTKKKLKQNKKNQYKNPRVSC